MTNKIQDIYILRRTKDDLAKINTRLELPPCYFENVELDMFPDERRLYEFVFQDAQETIRDAFKNAISLTQKHGNLGMFIESTAGDDLASHVS
jgi:hypothetical protein